MDMILDGGRRNEKFAGNLFVGMAGGDQICNLALARREAGEQFLACFASSCKDDRCADCAAGPQVDGEIMVSSRQFGQGFEGLPKPGRAHGSLKRGDRFSQFRDGRVVEHRPIASFCLSNLSPE